MAKKRKRPYRSTQTATRAQNDKVVESRRALDGFVNSLAYLGEASDLTQASDYERNPVTRDWELLTVMYRESWVAKRIIDTPCEDMTRAWYSISSELQQDRLDELTKLEAKHNIKQEITNALRWARLYGGAVAVMVIKDQEDMLDQPLDYDMLLPGCFRGLIVVDSTSISPSVELEGDMDDPDFGDPMYYDVVLDQENGEYVRVHHSRVLTFKGRMLPIREELTENHWGASELEHIYEELQKRNATSANIAQLVFQANVSALKLGNFGEALAMGTDEQKRKVLDAIFQMNRIKSSFGLLLMGNEDNYEQHPYSFAGLSEVYESFMMDMAGAAEIPATKLYGRSPQGMNATGESDMKNYYEKIAQLQENQLKPAIEKLLPVMCMSLWGVVPDDIEIVFEPIGTTTPSERAAIMQQISGSIIQIYSAGLLTQKAALLELKKLGKDIGVFNFDDDMIEKAEDEFETGEMGGEGGMPGMPGMPGMEAGGMPEEPKMGGAEQMPMGAPEGQPEGSPEGAPEGEQEEPQPEKEQDSAERVQTMVERLKKAQEASEDPDRYKTALERAEKLQEKLKETGEDGGPGSGPKPGYHKNGSSLMERAKFMADPTEGLPEPKRAERTHESVQKANQERKEWSDLTMHQKIAGNAAQERHIAKVKKQVMKAAAKGDLEKARKIVKANRHYWSNDPDSAMKVQSETMERQKAEEPGFLRRVAQRLLNRRRDVDNDPLTDYNKDDVAGDFNPYHDEDGKFSSKNGAVMNGAHWAANEESIKVAGPTKSREYTKSYIAKHPKVAKMAEKLKHVRSMVQNFAKDHPNAEEGTYSATTGKPVEDMKGFCVTFHQNLAKDDPFGGYTDDDYAEMCAVAMDELGCSDVNIGYFGNPEVSFTCEDPQKAMDFAIKHNQHSIFNTNNFKTMKNPYYRKSLNPIEGH